LTIIEKLVVEYVSLHIVDWTHNAFIELIDEHRKGKEWQKRRLRI
jgi:hypothetical protein